MRTKQKENCQVLVSILVSFRDIHRKRNRLETDAKFEAIIFQNDFWNTIVGEWYSILLRSNLCTHSVKTTNICG